MQLPTALTIAGSDCSGGAGIQADIKTFSAHGVFGMSAITAVVAENTCRVAAIEEISPDMIRRQIEAVLEDLPVGAIKLGMLPSAASMEAVSQALHGREGDAGCRGSRHGRHQWRGILCKPERWILSCGASCPCAFCSRPTSPKRKPSSASPSAHRRNAGRQRGLSRPWGYPGYC